MQNAYNTRFEFHYKYQKNGQVKIFDVDKKVVHFKKKTFADNLLTPMSTVCNETVF